jgi:hypothetical protein
VRPDRQVNLVPIQRYFKARRKKEGGKRREEE